MWSVSSFSSRFSLSLCKAWLNEKFAPDLLEHKTEIVESVMFQIKETVCKPDIFEKLHPLFLNTSRKRIFSMSRKETLWLESKKWRSVTVVDLIIVDLITTPPCY